MPLINMEIYRTLIARGLSEAEAEAAAVRAMTVRLPALYHALIVGCGSPQLALAAVEEVANYSDQQRHPVTYAVGSWLGRKTG